MILFALMPPSVTLMSVYMPEKFCVFVVHNLWPLDSLRHKNSGYFCWPLKVCFNYYYVNISYYPGAQMALGAGDMITVSMRGNIGKQRINPCFRYAH